MTTSFTATTKALVLREGPPDTKPLYHQANSEEKPVPSLKDGEVLVRIRAAGFNRRDVRIHLHYVNQKLKYGRTRYGPEWVYIPALCLGRRWVEMVQV